MKTLLMTLVLAFSSIASADDFVSSQLLSTLIHNASKVELVGSEETESLASILSSALAVETLVEDGKTVVLTSVSSSCKEQEVRRNYTCTLSITNGDYLRKGGSYIGPELESSVILEFETFKQRSITGRGGKHQLKGTKVKVSRAG